MPYYTISYNQDKKNNENVGNSYSKYIINDLLREKYSYNGVVCTDWAITEDNKEMDAFISGKCWGVENLSVEERHYKALMAGVDQFGGNNEVEPVIKAYEIGVKEHGEEFMRSRFEKSAVRLLLNMFRIGLFENPYVDTERSKEIVGNPEFMQSGYNEQLNSIVILKNKENIMPIKERKKVYIPRRRIKESKDWFGNIIPAYEKEPVNKAIIEKYYDVVEDSKDADFSIVFIESPKTVGYTKENGYLPISLQYRKYTALTARENSIAGGDPLETSVNRSYLNKTNYTSNEADLDIILETKKAMGNKPVIVSINMTNPTVVAEFEKHVDGIIVEFGVQTQAIMDIVSGKFNPSGLLPFQMPVNMETVENQCEDVPHDMECYKDELGNVYDFSYGLDFNGIINDDRVKKYKTR